MHPRAQGFGKNWPARQSQATAEHSAKKVRRRCLVSGKQRRAILLFAAINLYRSWAPRASLIARCDHRHLLVPVRGHLTHGIVGR